MAVESRDGCRASFANGEAVAEPSGGLGIGSAAERLGLHPRTLMAYERIGLIRPRRRRTRRIYTENDLRWLTCVQDFNHTAGVSLRGLSMLRRFVPCWAVRTAMETSPPDGSELPGPMSLDRVDRAYRGQASHACRECGVYQEGLRDAQTALASRNARERRGEGPHE